MHLIAGYGVFACLWFINPAVRAEIWRSQIWRDASAIPITALPWQSETTRNLSDTPTWIDGQVQRLMRRWNLPALSFAISNNDSLKVVRSYGYANVEQRTLATPTTSFRIASCSKPITGMAIFGLIEDGRLRLDSTIFGPLGVLGTQYGIKPYSNYLQAVTVRHLLLHAVPGWSDEDGEVEDPDDARPDLLTTRELISYVVDNVPLTAQAGSSSDYCNICYTILGHVVESVSGLSYEGYVRQRFLTPSGVSTAMRIGQSRPGFGEATYYVKRGDEDPNTELLTRFQGSGGWVATPVDYLRLVAHVDLIKQRPDVLREETIRQMVLADGPDRWQAKGWGVDDDGSWSHEGAIPGTSATVYKGPSGVSWALFVNVLPDEESYYEELRRLMTSIVNRIRSAQWPTGDLFV